MMTIENNDSPRFGFRYSDVYSRSDAYALGLNFPVTH